MNGLKKTYSFDTDFFKYGDAYHMHEKAKPNVYINAILVGRTEDTLSFITNVTSHYPDGKIEIKLTDLVGYSHWEITKMTCDYKNQFSSEE